MKKKLLYVTGSRAEYGIMKRLLLSLSEDDEIELSIIATGMHCDSRYGMTYKVIENDGLNIEKLIDININNETNANVLESMAICQNKFGKYFQENKFDAVMLLGDRYEIFAVAIAAAMHNLPIIHLHGGEKTLGNYDEFIRHAITKMSRLHFVSTEEYKKRVIQLGENPDTVFNVGALGAENSFLLNLPSKQELEKKFGSLHKKYLIVVFHPETLSELSVEAQYNELLYALEIFTKKYDFIFIGSNSDTGSNKIKKLTEVFCKKYDCRYMISVTPEEYLALNKYSEALIGNSSSGLIEIPSLKIPTINIGDRQKGRVRGDSVIDTLCEKQKIVQSIHMLDDNSFINKCSIAENPYYSADVKSNIMKLIKLFLLDNRINANHKDFYDL